MKYPNVCALIFSLAILVCMPQTATSSLPGSNQNTAAAPFTQDFPIQDEASFKANTTLFHQAPFKNPKYEFDIMLPKDWTSESIAKPADQSLKQDIPEMIARFKSPMIGTAQALITVQVQHLRYEISAENWLRNYVITNGYSLQEKVTALGNKKVGMAYVSVFEAKSTYGYTTAQINGDTVIMVTFEIPLYLKEQMAVLQKYAVESFRLTLVNDNPVEKQKEYNLSDALKFTYPESWVVHYPDFKDLNNMSVQLHNETSARKIYGLIRFMAIHRNRQTSLAQEMTRIRKYFDEFLGLEVAGLVSSETPSLHNRFMFSRYEVYQVEAKKKNVSKQEIRLAVLGDQDWYIIVFLLTPRETDNMYVWARNTRTFDMILQSMK
ncbi:MAG: hypothetical protein HY052_05310 [Proteobacteria bacterium]|nr:hypothetical protein [Pseudomonadota bacterium]